MHSQEKENQNGKQSSGFMGFVIPRIVISIVAVTAVVWILNAGLDRLALSPRSVALVQEDASGGEQTSAADNPQPLYGGSPAIDSQGTAEPSPEPESSGGHTDGPLEMPDSQDINADSTGEVAPDQPPPPLPTAETSDSEHKVAAIKQDMPPDSASMHRADASMTLEEKEATQAVPSTSLRNEPSRSGPQAESTKADKRGTGDHAQPAEPAGTQKHSEESAKPEQKEVIESHEPTEAPAHEKVPVGVAFVEAVMRPIDEELSNRFWGWRPNDIINVTDNVNHIQLGVLEVTRRTVVQLTQRISRTGSTDAFNPHLENAMNWLMVKADRYWFPSPESKYRESLKELSAYRHMLLKKKASFYIRTDNLIPLLEVFEDLLGSCDENLVKTMENDGSAVSFFKADDYFYYAQGVAAGMAAILEAVHHDFLPTLESRNGSELLHHAITSCKAAAQLSPLFIMNSDLDGIFANHRANIAAPISHARFYIGQLIKTLST
jgi:hypothetical protein